MTIIVEIPSQLRIHCDGASRLTLSAPTVRASLLELERTYPALHHNICDETGAVRRHINVFVNESHMRELGGLDTALKQGDILTILPAVSGG